MKSNAGRAPPYCETIGWRIQLRKAAVASAGVSSVGK